VLGPLVQRLLVHISVQRYAFRQVRHLVPIFLHSAPGDSGPFILFNALLGPSRIPKTLYGIWSTPVAFLAIVSSPSRRLDDRIRELCSQALIASNSELDTILSNLRSALRDHAARLRKLAVKKLVRAENGQPQDRRSA
jgi:hypothetical protein